MDILQTIALVDPRANYEQLVEEWNKIQEFVQTLDPRDPYNFVIKIHAWARVTQQLPMKSKAWNVFTALTSENYGCNCFCTTLLILMCCLQVNLLGNPIIGLFTYNHIFISNVDRTLAFETTFTCQTHWIDMSQMYRSFNFNPNERFPSIVDGPGLISAIVDASPNPSYSLFQRYPDWRSPRYYYAMITRGSGINVQLIQDFFTLLEVNHYLAAFSQDILNVMIGLRTVRSRPVLEDLLQTGYRLLTQAAQNNPNNTHLQNLKVKGFQLF